MATVAGIVLIHRTVLLFFMSLWAMLILFLAAGSLSALAAWPLQDRLPIRAHDLLVLGGTFALLSVAAVVGRARLRDLDDASCRRIGLAAWMRNAAWVTGWCFALLCVVVLLVGEIAPDEFALGDDPRKVGLGLLLQGILICLDIVLSSLLFDVVEVFDLRLSSLTPTGMLGRSVVVVAKFLIAITFVRCVFTLAGLEGSARARLDFDDLGFLGLGGFVLLGIVLLWAYMALVTGMRIVVPMFLP